MPGALHFFAKAGTAKRILKFYGICGIIIVYNPKKITRKDKALGK